MPHRIVEEDLRRIVAADLPWENLHGKTVLITGANGALAAYMVETLLALNQWRDGHRTNVIGLVRNADKASARFAKYRNRDDFQLLVQDVSQPIVLDEPVDMIIHAASQASPKYYGVDPVGTLAANVLGTQHLLELARAKQSEAFLFFSSSEVYGQGLAQDVPIAEMNYGWIDPCNVRSCYAESKRMGETMCVSWQHQYGVPTKIVRPFHTYGPGMALDDGRVYADFIADIVANRNITMTSDGSATRAFCYIADAVIGFLQFCSKAKLVRRIISVPISQKPVFLNWQRYSSDCFRKNLEVVRTQPTSTVGYLPSQISRVHPNIAKARSLGWEPIVSLEDGFRRTIASFSAE